MSGSDREEAPALVPRDGVFEGQVAVLGETRIEGAVQGSLRGPGRLVLGEGGRIEGAVDCDSVDVTGTIVGPVVARSQARLGPGACLEGDLEAARLEVDDAATWNGRVQVGG